MTTMLTLMVSNPAPRARSIARTIRSADASARVIRAARSGRRLSRLMVMRFSPDARHRVRTSRSRSDPLVVRARSSRSRRPSPSMRSSSRG